MIDENEMNNSIEEARQKLRNERSSRESLDKTSGSTIEHGTSTDGTSRPGVQLTASRDRQSEQSNRRDAGDHAGERDTERSTEKKSIRIGQRGRRSGSANTGNANTQQETGRTDTAPRIGGIERVDPVFYRPEEKKEEPAKPKPVETIVSKLIDKLPASSEDIPFIGGKGKGKLFSKKEAEEFYEPLGQAISDYGDYLDIYMDKIEPGHPPTWGNLTPKELELATRALLRMAQVNPRAASFTRLMIDGQDYIGLFVILIPRISITLQFAGRRIPRKSRQK